MNERRLSASGYAHEEACIAAAALFFFIVLRVVNTYRSIVRNTVRQLQIPVSGVIGNLPEILHWKIIDLFVSESIPDLFRLPWGKFGMRAKRIKASHSLQHKVVP